MKHNAERDAHVLRASVPIVVQHHPVELHVRFLNAIGYSPEKEDRANRLLPMEIQIGCLRDTGFVEVDCYWKWLEIDLWK